MNEWMNDSFIVFSTVTIMNDNELIDKRMYSKECNHSLI